MGKIVMTRGLPASFKSSWAKDRAEKLGWIRVSLDDLRESVYGGWHPRREKYILNLRDAMVRSGIEQGKTVVVDATNLHPKHERRLRALAEELGVPFEIEDSFLQRTPMECIEADLHRGKNAVGSKVIWEMYYRWIAPNPVAKLQKEFDKPRAVICDIDGSLAMNASGGGYYGISKTEQDSINPFIGCVIDALSEYGREVNYEKYPSVLLLTDRPEEAREATEEWLDRNCLRYDKLIMREHGDERPEEVVKAELYQRQIAPHYAVLGVIDDRPKVCRMWRGLGLMTLQAGCPEVEF